MEWDDSEDCGGGGWESSGSYWAPRAQAVARMDFEGGFGPTTTSKMGPVGSAPLPAQGAPVSLGSQVEGVC